MTVVHLSASVNARRYWQLWFLWSYSATGLKPEVQMMNGNVLAVRITKYVAYRRSPWLVIRIMPK
jgi:hypothetical protein